MNQIAGTSRRGARYDRDWTKGSITRNLLSLIWPVMVSQIINTIGSFIDMIWVAKLGAASVAGVGIAGMVVMLVNAAMSGLIIGMRVLIARFVGAGHNEIAVNVARQGFIISIVFSLVVAVIGAFFSEPILMLLGVEADVVTEGAAYLRIQFVGMVTMSLRLFTEGVMQASGDVMTPMRIGITFRVIHIALCPFLIFGWWLFPRLGVSGAATTALIAQSLGAICGLWVLLSGRTRLRLTLSNLQLDLNMIWRMVKIGIPNTFMQVQQHFNTLILTWFIAPFGTMAVAAHYLWQNINTILLTVSMGGGMGAGVLGAQNLGANQPERAAKSGWLGVGFISIIMFIGSAVLLLWAEGIAGIFSSEPGLVKMTGTFLRISAASYIAMGINFVLMQFLVGVGDTLVAFLGELIPTWGVQIPLAYFLPKTTSLGVFGIRWAIVIRMFFAAAIFTLYFWRGKWNRKRV